MIERLKLIKQSDKPTITVWSISLILIFLGISISILLYSANRGLWLDEAMLAYSFNTRSFFNLTTSILEWDQSSPILYLYIVKIITLIFGTSEMTLRIFSLFSFIGVLVLVYILMDKAIKVRYPIMSVAFISNISVLLYYSNEFKPYMCDCFSVLMVLYLYYLFKENKIKLFPLSVVYAVLLWLSYPSIFFIGGVFIYEFILSILCKDKKIMFMTAFGGIIILISFFIMYIVWLKPVANDDYMINYWQYYKFPLVPKNIEDIKKMFSLFKEMIAGMASWSILIGYFITTGVLVTISKKNNYSIVILISTLLVLIASYIGKYPFYQRLMLFIYPIFSISIFIALDSLMMESKKWSKNIVIIGLIIIVLLSNFKSTNYLKENRRYNAGEETSRLIEYVNEHIQENEMIYVYYHSIPVFSFKNGYGNLHIGENIDENIQNVILGEHFDNKYTKDIETILKLDKCYILFSHRIEERIAPLMKALKENGALELVMEEHSTPLYLFINGSTKK